MLYIFAGLFGTFLALRLMAIDAQESKSILTRRGRIVVGIIVGLVIGAIVVGINGMWWNCDSGTCSFTWGY
jgi:predicted Co/Zn/Cd cation transporter (cation efflux family)